MKLTKDALEYLAILGETNQFSEGYWIVSKYPLRIYGNEKIGFTSIINQVIRRK